MGDIIPGDFVLDAAGQPVEVVATTGVHVADQWRITFSREGETEQITASGDHLWPVMSSRVWSSVKMACARRGLPMHTGLWQHRAEVIDTHTLVRRMQDRQKLTVPSPSPHVGDSGPQWAPDDWMADLLVARGEVGQDGRPCLAWHSRSDRAPDELIRARSWLTGRGVKTLLRRERTGGSFLWRLAVAGSAVARMLPAQDDRAMAASVESGQDEGWSIERVEHVGPGSVQCIQVDSPDHLYLCGEAGIPTHNSMIASVLACWWISTRPLGEAIVVSTAPSYPQVNKILWEEIRKHHATAKRRGHPMVGYVTQGDEWKTADGRVLGFGRKPPTGDQGAHAFQGIHRRFVLVIMDEACGIPGELWTGAEAITTNEGCRILAIGNPDDRNTDFGDVFLSQNQAQDWNRISVPASCTPNLTGEPVPALLNEVLVSKSWVEERERAWGREDPRFKSKIMAEFPEESKSSLFTPSVIAGAFEEVPPQPVGQVVRLGVDVARFGGDDNVVISHVGSTARVESTWNGTDTVSSAYQVLHIAEEAKKRAKASWVEIRVDAVGLGAGVVDTLNARLMLLEKPWFSVYEMHGNASPPANVGGSIQGYGNARAFWFDQLRQSMRNGRVRIEEHEQVKDDLRIVFYHYKGGKLFIMSKEEMRKLHKRSPDFADALAYATAPVADGLDLGSTVSQTAEEVVHGLESMEDPELSISPF